jgi:hypothetical protein
MSTHISHGSSLQTTVFRKTSEIMGRKGTGLFLTVIVFTGFWLRFLHLETPSLWWNEQLVAMTARFSFSYIYQWTLNCEIHPPYLYFLTKFILLMGDSDFVLRLFPAIAGSATVYFAYFCYKDFVGKTAALLLAAFIAANPLHIFVSRQLRPYAPFLLICVFKFPLYMRLVEEDNIKSQIYLLVCNTLLFSLNYITFLLVFCETIVLAIALIMRRARWFTTTLLYGSLSIVSSIPILHSFLSRSTILQTDLNTFDATRLSIASISRNNIIANLYYFDNALIQSVFLGFSIAGFVHLWRRNTRLAVVIGLLTFMPLVILILTKYSYDFRPWNAVFLMPLMLCPVACLFARIFRPDWAGRIVATLIALGAAIYFPAMHWQDYYTETSGIEGGLSKSMAHRLASFINHNEAIVVLDTGTFNTLNWYFRRWYTPNPLERQYSGPSRTQTSVVLAGVTGKTPTQNYQIVDEFNAYNLRAVRINIPRSVSTITSMPTTIYFPTLPVSVYSQAYAIENCVPAFEDGSLIPTLHDTPAQIVYEVLNEVSAPQQLHFETAYRNQGKGNEFILSCRFDDEDWQTLFWQQGITREKRFSTTLRRFDHYKKLYVRVTMLAQALTPNYPGSNLDMIALESINIQAAPLSANLFNPLELDHTIKTTGIHEVEQEGNNSWRWAVGPIATIAFDAPPCKESILMHFAINNPLPEQTLEISINGNEIYTSGCLPSHPWMSQFFESEIHIPVQPGRNIIQYTFSKQNSVNTVFNEVDKTPYSVAFTKLDLGY